MLDLRNLTEELSRSIASIAKMFERQERITAMSEEKVASSIVYALDAYARNHDQHEYGLPIYSDTAVADMVEIVDSQIAKLVATVERVRALLAAWQAAVTVCEHSFGPASHLGKMMIDQLQAAIDGDHIPDAERKVGK
jgi:hypothetical protein